MAILLFDSECNLCNSCIQFIIKRDPKGYFQFASLQGKTGQHLLKQHDIHVTNSIVLIENDRFYTKSTAVLKICRRLKGLWKLFAALQVIPPVIFDFFYDIIAQNRYKWFGKRKSCMVPSPAEKKRFLD